MKMIKTGKRGRERGQRAKEKPLVEFLEEIAKHIDTTCMCLKWF